MTRPLFHYDLNCPWSWLAAERISGLFAGLDAPLPEWRPVAGDRLDRDLDGDSTASDAPAQIATRARELGLPEPRFPREWPSGSRSDDALKGVLYAGEAGRIIAVSLAAFRQQFLAGRSLAEPDNFLIAAASCELHPNAISRGIRSRSVGERLEENMREAVALSVRATPSVTVGGEVFTGESALEAAVLAAREVAGVKD